MIDFHSHFLPGIDDGADSLEMSLAMLRESREQGVDLIFATPHFYADEDDPESFLKRRDNAYRLVREAIEAEGEPDAYPAIQLGAEVLFFPGMSVADELRGLMMGESSFLLVEPPMMPWSDSMLDEIALTGENLDCMPVIAHLDRFMRILRDNSLFEHVEKRRMLIQVNADFFIREFSRRRALDYLRQDRIHFIGSDCHNMDNRAPNMGVAAQIIRRGGLENMHIAMDERNLRFL